MIIDALETAKEFLKEVFEQETNICFFTGAGISTGSGIPDFRSPGGIWSQYRIIDINEFITSEEARLHDWERRFHMMELFEQAKPNCAHLKIAELINKDKSVGVITQNIDGLHEKSGVSRNKLIEFHGTGAHAHCISCGERYAMSDMQGIVEQSGISPKCHCTGFVKAAVVSFGEAIPEAETERAQAMVDSSNCVIAVGSSLQVWPAAGLLQRALSQNKNVIIINRDSTPFDAAAQCRLQTDISQTFEF